MPTLFVSDLHLSGDRLDITRQFEAFLAGPARLAERLYILGDLFEYWAGDDDLKDPFNHRIASALANCGEHTPTFLMHGNRDFLIGQDFARAARLTLINDPLVINIGAQPTLLLHGDTLCTDDVDYQRFRGEVRSAAWAIRFLATPLGVRKHRIEELRAQSEAQKQIKPAAIMDVNATAVAEAFRSHRLDRMIHGHTHRPAHHVHEVNGQTCQRWVLADWYATGSYLECNAQGWRSVALS